MTWVLMASIQGLAQAQFALGQMCTKGGGVLENDAQGFKSFSKVADQGSEVITVNIYIIKIKITSANMPEVQALAAKWLEKINN